MQRIGEARCILLLRSVTFPIGRRGERGHDQPAPLIALARPLSPPGEGFFSCFSIVLPGPELSRSLRSQRLLTILLRVPGLCEK
jgi:hypothetical protein